MQTASSTSKENHGGLLNAYFTQTVTYNGQQMDKSQVVSFPDKSGPKSWTENSNQEPGIWSLHCRRRLLRQSYTQRTVKL